MIDTITKKMLSPPSLKKHQESGKSIIVLSGDWNLRGIATAPELRNDIAHYADEQDYQWDLCNVELFDSAGAFILWQAWGMKLPANLRMRPEHERLFSEWKHRTVPASSPMAKPAFLSAEQVTKVMQNFLMHILSWMTLMGQLVLDLGHLIKHPQHTPWKEISFTIYKAGVQALGITALLGFLIGLSLSYLSSLQLQRFGAEIYIIDLLGLSIIREIGPLLTAILVAGRSGSSMTAQIGIMRVTQELDALAAMGVSHSLRLILPKVVALGIALPLLVVWNEMVALTGGMLSAKFALDISFHQFIETLPKVVPIVNFYIGLAKGVVFGVMIAMIACHFGFLIKPNTESLGNETTNSVVASIIVVILIDTIFAIVFRNVGFP
jgi:phospholipid/cholesterol/gamma-HCH transport system permease protein